VLLACLLTLGTFTGTAEAFHWHLGYGQAKHASKEFAYAVCKAEGKCTGYGVGGCKRISDSRIDCPIGLFYADQPEPGQETECEMLLHWGVDHAGYLALKRHGPPHCGVV
jgi:hypothetical protein